MALQPGDAAPDLTLPDSDHQQVPLASLWSEQPLALFFFPLAFSSTCTEELCTLRDDIGTYAGLNGRVAAISVDSPFALARYKQEIGADYPFLSDFNREASRAFGVLREAPVGPGLIHASERATFVIGTDGKVKYTWVGARPGLLPPFDEIKQALGNGSV
jgi:peroxiredoxin